MGLEAWGWPVGLRAGGLPGHASGGLDGAARVRGCAGPAPVRGDFGAGRSVGWMALRGCCAGARESRYRGDAGRTRYAGTAQLRVRCSLARTPARRDACDLRQCAGVLPPARWRTSREPRSAGNRPAAMVGTQPSGRRKRVALEIERARDQLRRIAPTCRSSVAPSSNERVSAERPRSLVEPAETAIDWRWRSRAARTTGGGSRGCWPARRRVAGEATKRCRAA